MQSHCFLKRNKYSALIYTTNTITTTSSSMATGSNSNSNNCSSGRGAVEQPTMRNLRFGLSSHFQFFFGGSGLLHNIRAGPLRLGSRNLTTCQIANIENNTEPVPASFTSD